jgi:hypothetical protein
VARMEERKDAHRVLVGKPERRNNLEDPGVDGGNIQMNLRKVERRHKLDRSGLGSAQVGGGLLYMR